MARGYGFRRSFGFRNNSVAIVGILFGIALGFLGTDVPFSLCGTHSGDVSNSEHLSKPRILSSLHDSNYNNNNNDEAITNQHSTANKHAELRKATVPTKKLVMIGVMTAAKFVNARGAAVHDTWAKKVPGDVRFFSSEGTDQITPAGFPIVAMNGVNDRYPPQKKSFLMLKYMYEYHINDYEWFMRVDDDICINGDNLGKFLRSVNSSEPRFIGQAGFGNQKEFGKMNVNSDAPYCMGGPGMIFSAETLRRFIPHISTCLRNLVTDHEDVELGRCVTKFANVTCSASFEVSSLQTI